MRASAKPPALAQLFYVDLRNPGLQIVHAKRLADEKSNARVLGADDFVLIGFDRHHNERQRVEFLLAAHMVKQRGAIHRRHIPIRNDQAVRLLVYFSERGFAIGRFVDVGKSQLRQDFPNNASNGAAVVHDQDFAFVIDRHFCVLALQESKFGAASYYYHRLCSNNHSINCVDDAQRNRAAQSSPVSAPAPFVCEKLGVWAEFTRRVGMPTRPHAKGAYDMARKPSKAAKKARKKPAVKRKKRMSKPRKVVRKKPAKTPAKATRKKLSKPAMARA